jgi:hypothetical protein
VWIWAMRTRGTLSKCVRRSISLGEVFAFVIVIESSLRSSTEYDMAFAMELLHKD